jgi:hypothetical protein
MIKVMALAKATAAITPIKPPTSVIVADSIRYCSITSPSRSPGTKLAAGRGTRTVCRFWKRRRPRRLLADAMPALAKKCKYPGCGGSTMLGSHAVPQRLLQQFAYYDPHTKSLRLWRYAKGRPPFNNTSPKTATRYPGHFSDPQDAAAEAHLEERLDREFEHPVTGQSSPSNSNDFR